MARQLTYTAAEHSAAAYRNDPRFAAGLEPAAIGTAALEAAVRKATGLVFPTLAATEEYCEKEMYPAHTDALPLPQALIPQAPGTFSDTVHIDGRRLYLPPATGAPTSCAKPATHAGPTDRGWTG